ncbi:hypothetical protein GCM10014719_31870 [Planomonospora parontospora subsp. antibiotica]|nr:hypothetical protein GCM10014719_31870 [Planomonospora parontospora subsp. antibiotica]GII16456.1 hypothetical protein Ppa05_31820 [Planomonospora parontospora subsp. antibiotica]
MGAAPVRKVSARELLDLRERAWSRRLRGSSLVAEADVRDSQSAQVASVLGRVYAKWVAERRPPERFFLRWPACVAVAVTGVAAHGYRQGTFWPELWKAVQYQGLPEDQAVWGRGFAAAADSLGLPTFPDMPMPYIGPILMHTGIPTYCLEDYFRLILQRRAQDRGLDGEGFLAWATASGRETRLSELDMPARRFLQHGTEFALDFVERSFDLLDRLREPAPDLDGVGLPPRVLERARQLAAEGRLDLETAPRGSAAGRVRAERPRIALDPFGRGVEVVLPAVGDTPDGIARWSVTADGVTSTVQSRAQWVGLSEAAPATTFSLLRPVRTVVVGLAGWEHRTELPVVDPAAPLLVFAEDGRRLPAGLPLPPDVVWVVYPEAQELTADGPPVVTVEGQLPLGWDGWRLRQISLEGVRSLELAGLPASRRLVRGYSRPRIVTGDPVAGVATPYGSAVYPRAPEVWLPGEAGADTTWVVEVRPSGSEAAVTETCTVSEPGSVTGLWDALPRPLLGSFDLVVRGPLGRGVKRTVFVAEGFGVRFTPQVRVFGTAGLADGRAELSAAVGARANPRTLSFDSDHLASVAEYRTAEHSEALVITPPHVQVLHERGSDTPGWRAGPLRIDSAVFTDEPGALLVRIPEAGSLPPLRVVVGGHLVQDVPPGGRSQEGTARYDLVRLADTVNEHQRADLLLEVGKEVVRLASVRPRRFADRAERDGGDVRLVGVVPVEGLTAGVYLARAPWREPLVVPVEEDGRIPLLPEFADAGPLLVHLQLDDPWVPAEWPRWPDHHLEVGGEGHLRSGGGVDAEEAALSRFLAEEGDFPAEIDDLGRVWTLVELAPRLRLASEVQRFLMACARPLQRRPQEALAALVKLGFEPDRLLACVISSGLAAVAVPDLEQARAARKMWAVAPVAAVLAGDLADGDCLAAAERQCGECLTEIAETGVDPHAAVGRFGREAERLAHLSTEQLEGIWRAADVVPRALLDADTRLSAARRLFDVRNESALREIKQVTGHAVKTARALLGEPQLLRQVEQRVHPEDRGGWYALPAASAALALLARLAARGDVRCRAAEQLLRADWARLAAVAPDLVTVDLIVAELLVGAAKRGTP